MGRAFDKGHIPWNKGVKMWKDKKHPKGMLGKKHPEKTKQKISNSLKGKTQGRKLSEETKWKMSEAKKGIHISPETEFKKGQTSWNKGKKRPEFSGKNHPRWKGGITSENERIRHSIEFSLWRESVFARDNWTCQKTGVKGGKLHPHHIKNFAQYPELRFAIDNGITLSEEAHREFHKKYGRKNNTQEQLEEFFTE